MKLTSSSRRLRFVLFPLIICLAVLALAVPKLLASGPVQAAYVRAGALSAAGAGRQPLTSASRAVVGPHANPMHSSPSPSRLLQTRCAPPINYDARDGLPNAVSLDQCYEQSFSLGGNTYWVLAYYTENAAQNTVTTTHTLPNVDDGSGNNIYAVQAVTETIRAWQFYMNKNFTVPSDGSDQIDIYLAEDNRSGGTPDLHTVNYDDEIIESNDNVWKTVVAHHEMFHIVQYDYDDTGGWQSWWGEGTARAIEDRVDSTVDADTDHWFMNQLNSYLNSKYREDVTTITYNSALWWNYMMDQHTRAGEIEPSLGVESMRRYFVQMDTDDDAQTGLQNHLVNEGSSFDSDWIDFTLANYAKDFNPGDSRLLYVDPEVMANTNPLNVVTSTVRNYAVDNNSPVQARAADYWEINPASNCDYVSYTFDGNGQQYGFSVMTVEGGNLGDYWTSKSTSFDRTVRSKSLDRVVGVVSALSNGGNVDIGYGCVSPQINIKRPTQAAYAHVGLPANPRHFIVRLEVFSDQATAIAGLTADDFVVQVGGITSTIASAAYVQDDYWLVVQAPGEDDGMQAGQFYNLTVQLDTASDTELNAVLYAERTQDAILVLDKSGSMSSSNKIQAARNAADLLVSELSDDDQGGLVHFDTDAALGFPLSRMGDGTNRQDIRATISGTGTGGNTSIGDGMALGAQERTNRGVAENVCGIILLSDGHENEPQYWADVKNAVLDTGCALHTIAFGPEANEPLLQEIVGDAIAAGLEGSYDYADVGGNVPVALQAEPHAEGLTIQSATMSWQNNLSRVYDFKAAQVAGRQRLLTKIGGPLEQGELPEIHNVYVDPNTGELMLAFSWQDLTDKPFFALTDPSGDPVNAGDPGVTRRTSTRGTNEVWVIQDPEAGLWQVTVSGLVGEYLLSATAQTAIEFFLFTGTPFQDLEQGALVPIIGILASQGAPVTGATVDATVTDPNGNQTTLRLYDDGNHQDGEQDDGVYVNTYRATASAEQTAERPGEGEEPQVRGSYTVNAVAVKNDTRREAQTSFAISAAVDTDQDGMPDNWETRHGLDPNKPDDANADPDGDGLTNLFEFRYSGTDPRNSDTDHGGESDGAEFNAQQNPLDPRDDRVGALSLLLAQAVLESTRPVVRLEIGNPLSGTLAYVDIYRREVYGASAGEWELISTGVATRVYSDTSVINGTTYEYRVIPFVNPAGGKTAQSVLQQNIQARTSEVRRVTARNDPYPPEGSIMINNGDASTDSLEVTLSLAADPDVIEMRLSNSLDFSGSDWTSFKPTITGWMLDPDTQPGEYAYVYVQYRDAAGNVSESGHWEDWDGILFNPSCTVPGDVDASRVVDTADTQKVVAAWRASFGQAGYKAAYDFNEDEQIRVDDVMYVTSRWGSTCSVVKLNPDADAQVSSADGDTNYGNAETMMAGNFYFISTYRTFVHFDLSAIPDTAVVQEAKLRLHTYTTFGGFEYEMEVHRAKAPWTESTLTWNNQPDLEPTGSKTTVDSEKYWFEWDVTALVQDWLASGGNYGLVVRSVDENFESAHEFDTREAAYEGARPPELVVTY